MWSCPSRFWVLACCDPLCLTCTYNVWPTILLPLGAAPPSPGMAPMGAGMPDMMMQQLFGEFPPDIPPELLKNLPKPGAANVDVGLRPEMYAEVLAAMQQAVKQNAENEQVWHHATG